MLRYKNVPTIKFALKNDYIVKAEYLYDKKSEEYLVSLYIEDPQIGRSDLVKENIKFVSKFNAIKSDIAHYITALIEEDFFEHYIKRYEYEQKCFDKGNEYFENERLNKENN